MATKGLLDFIFEQGSKPENLMRMGLLTPESIANPSAVKTAQTKYKKSLQNPAVAAREEGRLTNSPVINQGFLPERKIIRPEDIENTILVSHKGDTSSTDTQLLELGGVKFDNPPESRGGVRFGDSPKTPEELYWASMATGAVPLQNKAEGLMAAFDMPVTGVFGAMGDEALFFNDAFGDTMLQSAQKLPIPKTSIEIFDADMRKINDEWVGIKHPDARDQLLGLNGYPREGAGKFRSAFASKMSMAKYRDLGFPVIEDVKSVYRQPGLENTSLGDSGYVMGEIGQGYGLTKNTNHLSYDTGIMGNVLGGFEQSLPNRIAYPDAYLRLENEMTKPKDPTKNAPRLFNESEKVDAIGKRKDLFQIADARWVDAASKWLEDNKNATNAALILAVGLPAALAPQDADASMVGLLSKFGASRADLKGMADKMLDGGASPDEIWAKTGWEYNSADKQWRTELPNSKSELNLPVPGDGQVAETKLGDVLNDTEMLSQYDDRNRLEAGLLFDETEEYGSPIGGPRRFTPLSSIPVIIDNNLPVGYGLHTPASSEAGESIRMSGRGTPEDQRAVLLHEMQHGIQDREGFSSGGSEDYFASNRRATNEWSELYGPRLQALQDRRIKTEDEVDEMIGLEGLKSSIVRDYADSQEGLLSPEQMYRNLVGEVEAENVVTRDALSPSELRQKSPASTEQIANSDILDRSQQISRLGSYDAIDSDVGLLQRLESPNTSPNFAYQGRNIRAKEDARRDQLQQILSRSQESPITDLGMKFVESAVMEPVSYAAGIINPDFREPVRDSVNYDMGSTAQLMADKAGSNVGTAFEKYIMPTLINKIAPAVVDAYNKDSLLGGSAKDQVEYAQSLYGELPSEARRFASREIKPRAQNLMGLIGSIL